MPRAGLVSDSQPYQSFGTFAGLSFWPGGLTLLAAAPGVGKTSWLLRLAFEAAAAGLPAALGCYEHTPAELKFRLRLQAEAYLGGPHGKAPGLAVEKRLARGSTLVLLALSDQEDTVRSLEELLLQDYAFPAHGPVVVALDYLQRVPVLGPVGMLPDERRSGEAAAQLRALARRRGWALIAASALQKDRFVHGTDLSALPGDERPAYEADRVLLLRPAAPVQACGCVTLEAVTLKDRTGPAARFRLAFWGARFYPALESELQEGLHG